MHPSIIQWEKIEILAKSADGKNITTAKFSIRDVSGRESNLDSINLSSTPSWPQIPFRRLLLPWPLAAHGYFERFEERSCPSTPRHKFRVHPQPITITCKPSVWGQIGEKVGKRVKIDGTYKPQCVVQSHLWKNPSQGKEHLSTADVWGNLHLEQEFGSWSISAIREQKSATWFQTGNVSDPWSAHATAPVIGTSGHDSTDLIVQERLYEGLRGTSSTTCFAFIRSHWIKWVNSTCT